MFVNLTVALTLRSRYLVPRYAKPSFYAAFMRQQRFRAHHSIGKNGTVSRF